MLGSVNLSATRPGNDVETEDRMQAKLQMDTDVRVLQLFVTSAALHGGAAATAWISCQRVLLAVS